MEKIGDTVYRIFNSHACAEEVKINKIKELLERGYEVNSNLLGGFTALHFAVLRENYKVCEFLIEKGANPHIENCDCNTPLDLANGHDLYSGGKNKKLMNILTISPCNVFRPGMNRHKDAESALKSYNDEYGLNLKMGDIFQ